jgi:hypothetical protein
MGQVTTKPESMYPGNTMPFGFSLKKKPSLTLPEEARLLGSCSSPRSFLVLAAAIASTTLAENRRILRNRLHPTRQRAV